MADAVTSQTMHDGERTVIMKFTNLSDGTGESAVLKVDVSTLGVSKFKKIAPTSVSIDRVWYNVSGMAVTVLEDATTDVTLLVLQGDGDLDFREIGGVKMTGASGTTGDIRFTTTGHTLADSYTIVMEMSKNY